MADAFIENIIVGAGPAGIQMALYCKKYSMPYVVLEGNTEAGSFFKKYPRERKLISINKVHCASMSKPPVTRYDWNSLLFDDSPVLFNQYSEAFFPPADKMVEYLNSIVESKELNIAFNTRVVSISKSLIDSDEHFSICTETNVEYPDGLSKISSKTYTCKKLFIATGVKQKKPSKNLVELCKSLNVELDTYSTYEKNKYVDKSILIVGSGNAAFETAKSLNDVTESVAMVGPNKLAWKTHFPGHLRSDNMDFIDTFYLKMGNVIYMDKYTDVESIILQHDFLLSHGSRLSYVIYCGGFEYDTSIMCESSMPVLSDRGFPELNENFESINVPNLHFLGTLTQAHDSKVGTSSFIHGFRYNVQFLCRVLASDLEHKTFHSIEQFLHHIIERINTSGCLHHRFKMFCDYVIISKDLKTIWYYEDIFIPYLKKNRNTFHKNIRSHSAIQIYFDYGNGKDSHFQPHMKQPGGFSQKDIVIPFRDDISKFLHPVFKVIHHPLSNSSIERKFHVGESVTGQFYHFIYTRLVEIYVRFSFSQASVQDSCEIEKAVLQVYWDYIKHLKNYAGDNLSYGDWYF